MQRSTIAAYYRGGTSRAVIFQTKDLPRDRSKWGPIFLQVMGSPDPYGRQLDGMGAGVSSLSKICLVEPSEREDADVDYTFVGIGIERDEVDMAGNCGNMSSAIGPYAFNERLLKNCDYGAEGEVGVRIFNTNTGVIIKSIFGVANGQAMVEGAYKIDGVAGSGSRIHLDFLRPGGAKTGKLLPTGSPVNTIDGVQVSCVDAANPCIFVRAQDVGIDGTILPNDFLKLAEKLDQLEKIRKAGAVAMGMVEREDQVPRTIPKIGIVSPPTTHRVLNGETVDASSLDVVVRFISDGQPHRAVPLTAALCTAVAAKIKGTVVQSCLDQELDKLENFPEHALTIGHSSGTIQVNATMDGKGNAESATVYRTARRIFEGKVYWNE
ncbi:DUF453-domain-containing protein [Delitschia confertaspora ATCC 74209]|uniref:DUF453-domain-containing protein n=1 Tax=Delitschia confertaspora ATCC 74209 TaxID=1513339 RepID=A0A9P4JJE4_9PLEO|nr:DUF453-domain-containing protein [Delitschia confertaspora ATCC 74209]